MQRTMKTFGEYGQTVRVWQDDKAVRVQCRALGVTRSFRGPGAKAKAYGFAQRLASGMEAKAETRPTLADLWAAYTASGDYTGDQQRKHLLPALGKMVTAACRVIRRGGR